MLLRKFYFLFLMMLMSLAVSANSNIKDDYFLAIKGGISLGSYETGLNRSLLKYIQKKEKTDQARLIAFSGASAGSINSVLSAIDQCIVDKSIDSKSKQKIDSLENNFMQRSWDIGINELVPSEQLSKETTGIPQNLQGSIFSRGGFANKKQLISELLKRDARPGCKIIITMSITMVEPYSYQIKEISETINLQRFVIPVEVVEVNNQLKFKNFNVLNIDEKENSIKIPSAYLKLVENEQGYIDFDNVWKLALASSAFPLAFEPMSLSFCFPHDLKPQELCSFGRAKTSFFSDGGLFDNSPIGVSLELASQLKDGDLENIKLIYINPDSYRTKSGEVEKRVKSQPRSGLWDYGVYIAESFLTAQEQEYRSALNRILNLEARSYYMTNRFHHLLADLHYHFGAFYAEEFRFHDYLVGVYDGANVIAQIECDKRTVFDKNMNRSEANYQGCVREEVLKWIESISDTGVEESQINPSSLNFFKYLYNTEFDKSLLISESSNMYIALSQAFGSVNIIRNNDISYSEYLLNLDKLKYKLDLQPEDDLYKILYAGKKYTSQKVAKIFENIIQMQDLAANCDLCENGQANEKIGDTLKVVEPMVDSYLTHLDTGIWPLSIYDVLTVSYGFNISQKNQVLSLDFRPKFLSFNKLSTDFSMALHRFGNELANDNYQSASLGLTYHRDSLVVPTIGLGYQFETKGAKVYSSDLNSLYLKSSLMNEILSIKLLYRLDEVEQNTIITRDDIAFVITADIAKICQMVSPGFCR